MLKKSFLGFLCVLILLSSLAGRHYFFDELYISPGEMESLTSLTIDKNDYDSYLYVYLEGNQSFRNHSIQVRSRMTMQQGDYCFYEMKVFAFDRANANNTREHIVYNMGNIGWSEVAELYIPFNADFVQVIFDFQKCNLSRNASMDIDIAVDREITDLDLVKVSFWANEYVLSPGSCTYLNWEVENSRKVTLNGVTVNPYDSSYVCPVETTTYVLSATGHDGSVINRTVTIYMEEAPPAEIAFWADEYTLSTGECTYLRWQIDNIDDEWVYLDSIPKNGSSGEEAVCLDETTTFELCATGSDSEYRCQQVTVEVIDVSYQADRYSLFRGECTDISWDVPQASGGEIWWDGYYLPSTDSYQVCPDTTQTFEMCYTIPNSEMQCLELTIEVEEGAPYLLVVTHSKNLNTQVNTADAWDQIQMWIYDNYSGVSIIDLHELGIDSTDFLAIDEAIESRILRDMPSPPEYILILGGPAVVAFGEVDNPMWGRSCRTTAGIETCDWDILYTDDLYGDIPPNQDGLSIPEIPVARLPDGGDFEIFRIHFEQTPYPRPPSSDNTFIGNYAIGQPFRPSVNLIGRLMGASSIDYVPPSHWSSYNQIWGDWIYFILHGNIDNTSVWWGEEIVNGQTTYPEGWHINVSQFWNVVVVNACYGGYIGTPQNPKTTTDSIALSFLRNGTSAFMGHTISTYSISYEQTILDCEEQTCWLDTQWTMENIEEGEAKLGASVFTGLTNGMHPMDAFWYAKQQLAQTLGPSFLAELKDLYGFQFYGLPPFNQASF